MRKICGEELFFIWDESAWLSQNGIGSSRWSEYAEHIQGHGNLGKIYPKNKYGVEGDTPSFLYILPNGLNTPEAYNGVGWGGYFERSMSLDKETYCYTNSSPKDKEISQKYEKYFYPAIFANFAARMDWAEKGKGNRNPKVVINGNKGLEPICLSPQAGNKLKLDASKSTDLEHDKLSFTWWFLPEAGNYRGEILIEQHNRNKAFITIPKDAVGKTFHIICEVTDNGTPCLTSYRRIIITPVN